MNRPSMSQGISKSHHFKSSDDRAVHTAHNTPLWKNIWRIERLLSGSKDMIKKFKMEKAQLRQELTIMENHLKIKIADNVKQVRPKQDALLKELQKSISLEYDDGMMLKEQIIEMKKKNTELERIILDYEAKINHLELVIGIQD